MINNMDNREDKSEISQLSIEEVDECKATKSEEINNDQVIIDVPPKIVTIEGDTNTYAEQVKDKEEINNDQVIMDDPPKIVTIESEANTDTEQIKDEEENNSIPAEGNKNEQVEKEEKDTMGSPELVNINQIEKESKIRPIAFLLGLPFALISLVIAFIGGIIWIIGLILTCICPCCFCVTVLVEMALGLVNAPFQFLHYITDKIPF
ncbi:uncharacterized protein LOC129874868 [Solanum dulcamara]|uniref:uncharacterized protein LOC129874868 n=1 Tax=Solanum dulcamara TaxID=45834 RepID=UPI00248510F3|nr:uncharacterized protein LOC129874868 [Solanum dulcamara]